MIDDSWSTDWHYCFSIRHLHDQSPQPSISTHPITHTDQAWNKQRPFHWTESILQWCTSLCDWVEHLYSFHQLTQECLKSSRYLIVSSTPLFDIGTVCHSWRPTDLQTSLTSHYPSIKSVSVSLWMWSLVYTTHCRNLQSASLDHASGTVAVGKMLLDRLLHYKQDWVRPLLMWLIDWLCGW